MHPQVFEIIRIRQLDKERLGRQDIGRFYGYEIGMITLTPLIIELLWKWGRREIR
jgi:hypothetical protein